VPFMASSRFSLLRGLPSCVNAEESTSSALVEFEAALSQQKDPCSSSADVSALSLLQPLRKEAQAGTVTSNGSCADPGDGDAPYLSPWGNESFSDHEATQILFVDEGHTVDGGLQAEGSDHSDHSEHSEQETPSPADVPVATVGRASLSHAGPDDSSAVVADGGASPSAALPLSAGTKRAHSQHAEQLQVLLKALSDVPIAERACPAAGAAAGADAGADAGGARCCPEGGGGSSEQPGMGTPFGSDGGVGAVDGGASSSPGGQRAGDSDDAGLDDKLDGVRFRPLPPAPCDARSQAHRPSPSPPQPSWLLAILVTRHRRIVAGARIPSAVPRLARLAVRAG
jgi:hypothetical protein